MIATPLASIALLTAVGWNPTGLRWNTGEFPIPYCITTNATRTNVNQAGQRAAILEGINAWVATGSGGNLSCTTYQAAAAGFSCSTGVNTRDRRPNIFWTRNWSNGSSAIGVTWSTGSGRSCGTVTDDTGRRHNLQCKFDADIEFNDRDFTWTNTGRSGTDIASITAHEYGHFIGLDHCNENNTCQRGAAIMYAAYGGGAVRVPFNDDVQGACGLYQGTPGGLGWPCSGNNECNSRLCVTPGSGGGYCSQTCSGSCPSGFRCGTNPQNANQQVCLRDDGLNKDVCEVCQQGIPDACVNGGICARGLPESDAGRCVQPCQSGRTCADSKFQCLTVQFQGGGSGDFCFPRSQDCTDLNNFSELQQGQACNGSIPCANGLTCVGICAPACDGGQACPSGWACETRFQNGAYCLPSVGEGQDCSGLVTCTTGPCLRTQAGTYCYRDCAGNSGACNNAQMCNTYNVSGGQVSICEPPGVPPNPPDAGVVIPDMGMSNPADTGTSMGQPDAGTQMNNDAGTQMNADAGGNNMSGQCDCDQTFACDPGCESCDPECEGNCECDNDYSCDPSCECDYECLNPAPTPSNCACLTTPLNGQNAGASLLLGLFFGALLLRRRRA